MTNEEKYNKIIKEIGNCKKINGQIIKELFVEYQPVVVNRGILRDKLEAVIKAQLFKKNEGIENFKEKLNAVVEEKEEILKKIYPWRSN